MAARELHRRDMWSSLVSRCAQEIGLHTRNVHGGPVPPRSGGDRGAMVTPAGAINDLEVDTVRFPRIVRRRCSWDEKRVVICGITTLLAVWSPGSRSPTPK